MKASSVILFLFPILSSAQIDYCPCEEEANNSEDLMNMVSSINSQINLLIPRSTYTYGQKTQKKPIKKSTSTPAPLPKVIESEEDKVGPTVIRTDRQRKSRKLFRKKVKRANRPKRYKGQCPRF